MFPTFTVISPFRTWWKIDTITIVMVVLVVVVGGIVMVVRTIGSCSIDDLCSMIHHFVSFKKEMIHNVYQPCRCIIVSNDPIYNNKQQCIVLEFVVVDGLDISDITTTPHISFFVYKKISVVTYVIPHFFGLS